MRNLIANIAKKLGITTAYMISFQAPLPGGGYTLGCTSLEMRPWLRVTHFDELLDHLKTLAPEAKDRPIILSITRLAK